MTFIRPEEVGATHNADAEGELRCFRISLLGQYGWQVIPVLLSSDINSVRSNHKMMWLRQTHSIFELLGVAPHNEKRH
jgi:hypothetical protein